MSINRRNFLKKTSLSTAAIASTPLFSGYDSEVNNLSPSGGLYMGDFAAQKLSKIRAAFIGLGSRGGGHLNFFAGLPGAEVVAISDLYEDKVKEKLKNVANDLKISAQRVSYIQKQICIKLKDKFQLKYSHVTKS